MGAALNGNNNNNGSYHLRICDNYLHNWGFAYHANLSLCPFDTGLPPSSLTNPRPFAWGAFTSAIFCREWALHTSACPLIRLASFPSRSLSLKVTSIKEPFLTTLLSYSKCHFVLTMSVTTTRTVKRFCVPWSLPGSTSITL